MEFNIWNLFTEECDCEEGADIIVDLDSSHAIVKEMACQEMQKLGFTDSQIENEFKHGDFYTYVDTKGRFSEGGFPVGNPEVSGDLYFFRRNGEMIGTGYFFTEAEQEELHGVVNKALEETQKGKEDVE